MSVSLGGINIPASSESQLVYYIFVMIYMIQTGFVSAITVHLMGLLSSEPSFDHPKNESINKFNHQSTRS